ncbi:MAG: HIT family protein [Chloroflexota bacterium]|nr:HIT family protein [Chloroflexota bacterium]
MQTNPSAQHHWNDMRAGRNCSLCVPRQATNDYRIVIAALSSSTLYLFRDQRFRGYCLLIFDPRHATALEELSEDEYMLFMQDVRQAAQAIRSALQPDHMNYECLGNSSPHLHWHLVPRYHTDPRWGQPIWEGWQRNEFNINRVTLADHEYADLIRRIRAALPAP